MPCHRRTYWIRKAQHTHASNPGTLNERKRVARQRGKRGIGRYYCSGGWRSLFYRGLSGVTATSKGAPTFGPVNTRKSHSLVIMLVASCGKLQIVNGICIVSTPLCAVFSTPKPRTHSPPLFTSHMSFLLHYRSSRWVCVCLSPAYVLISHHLLEKWKFCLLYTSPSPRDQRGSRMPSSA